MVGGFVLDASVTAAWCFADEATAASDALRDSLTERHAVVPVLWHAESTNLLLLAERRRRITPHRCDELLELLGSLPIETVDGTGRVRGPVLRLARAHRLTTCDAIYLDLAMDHGLPLATRGGDLRRAAGVAGVVLIDA
jgi:predicted nucleic acid-binding protein